MERTHDRITVLAKQLQPVTTTTGRDDAESEQPLTLPSLAGRRWHAEAQHERELLPCVSLPLPRIN